MQTARAHVLLFTKCLYSQSMFYDYLFIRRVNTPDEGLFLINELIKKHFYISKWLKNIF